MENLEDILIGQIKMSFVELTRETSKYKLAIDKQCISRASWKIET